MENNPKRKRNRLEEYDYGATGAYFITICTHEKRCILSEITADAGAGLDSSAVGEGLAPPAAQPVPPVVLTEIGKIAETHILALPERFPTLSIDKYVIMPNHIHMLLTLHDKEDTGRASPAPTVSDIVRVFKSLTTRLSRPFFSGQHLFQRSFHDHVIRNENDYRTISEYIDANPARWADDGYYTE